MKHSVRVVFITPCLLIHSPCALIPNEGSVQLRFGVVDKRGVLDIFKTSSS